MQAQAKIRQTMKETTEVEDLDRHLRESDSEAEAKAARRGRGRGRGKGRGRGRGGEESKGGRGGKQKKGTEKPEPAPKDTPKRLRSKAKVKDADLGTNRKKGCAVYKKPATGRSVKRKLDFEQKKEREVEGEEGDAAEGGEGEKLDPMDAQPNIEVKCACACLRVCVHSSTCK